MTSGEPIVDLLLVGRAIVNPLGLSPRQYVARKARDCRRRARELRLQLERQVTDFEILLGDVKRQDFSGIHEAWPMFADIEETRNSLAASETRLLHLARIPEETLDSLLGALPIGLLVSKTASITYFQVTRQLHCHLRAMVKNAF